MKLDCRFSGLQILLKDLDDDLMDKGLKDREVWLFPSEESPSRVASELSRRRCGCLITIRNKYGVASGYWGTIKVRWEYEKRINDKRASLVIGQKMRGGLVNITSQIVIKLYVTVACSILAALISL
ncbi:MHC class IIB antigen, partial [Striga asiatica]